jgi:hypothetical protein
MKAVVDSIVDKEQWLVELGFDRYTPTQKVALWDLVMRALETKAMDVLLDELAQEDQRKLVQYLSEDELSDQMGAFLEKKIPGYTQLINKALLEYKKQLKRDLSRLVRQPEDEE